LYQVIVSLNNQLNSQMSDLQSLITDLLQFRDDRDWKQFHNAKDLALAIAIEAGELNELFLWKTANEANREKLKKELADVLIYALLLAHTEGLDVVSIIREKLEENSRKYPVDKAKGTAKKYNEL